MTRDDFLYYWLSYPEWFSEENNDYHIKENAPEKVKRSFEAWKKQQDFY